MERGDPSRWCPYGWRPLKRSQEEEGFCHPGLIFTRVSSSFGGHGDGGSGGGGRVGQGSGRGGGWGGEHGNEEEQRIFFCHLGWIFTRVSRTFGQNNPNQQNSSTRLNVMDRKHHTAHHTRKHHTQLQKSWRAEDSSLWGENNKPSQMKMQTLEISGVHQKNL